MNTKKLWIYITNENFVKNLDIAYKTLEADELFNTQRNHNEIANTSIDQLRETSIQRTKRLYEYGWRKKDIPYFPLHYALAGIVEDAEMRRGINVGVGF